MKHRIFNIVLFTIYIIAMTALMIWQGIGITPDRYAFVLLLVSLLIKRARSFILDWIPFLFILLSHDFLRGFADKLGQRVDYVNPTTLDEKIFGTLPTISLQNLFYNPAAPSWYDYFATIFYFLHFTIPLIFAYILWIYNKKCFKQFITAILLLSYSAWATFLIYPAAPPWLASNKGYLPGVHKIMDATLAAFPQKWDVPTIYHSINPNPVAAMPSLHAAYPLLVLLFALHFFKLRALIFLPYVLIVWISLVYLGEHFVADILAGAIYAAFFYFTSVRILHSIDWKEIKFSCF